MAVGVASSALASGTAHPLVRVTLLLRDGPMRRIVVRGQWRTTTGALAPETTGAVLRIVGAPGEGDSGPIHLPRSRWRRLGASWHYVDRDGTAGGIRRVVVRQGTH